MKIHRLLHAESVELDLDHGLPPEDPENPERAQSEAQRAVFRTLCERLDAAEAVTNVTKLVKDFEYAEGGATSGIGNGIAVPHVRTLRCRKLAMAFGRSRRGFDFGSVDGQPVHYVCCVVAPPYDDGDYRQLYTAVARALTDENCRAMIDDAESPDEVIWALQSFL